MRRKLSRALSLVMVLMLTVLLMTPAAVRAEDDEDSGEDTQMNLDVIFVIDASGSMLESDPNKVALDAFKLFVDLSDETCGVGYVVYTEYLKDSSPVVPISNKKNLDDMKKKISSIQYDPNGDTDIALGLTKAMQLHDQNKDPNRKKLIILLSDGNTHLVGYTRSMEASKKEMDSTLKSLSEKNIPVYSIGLNHDKTLDKKEIEKISNTTAGKAYEATSSRQLTGILSDIFSDVYRLDGEVKEIVDGKVSVEVKDSSVFYVNLIIRSSLTLEQLRPVIVTPFGKEIAVTKDVSHLDKDEEYDAINVTSSGTYTLIKFVYPHSGFWNVRLKNATNDNCQITQLDFYSVFIKQTINETGYVTMPMVLEASMNDKDGVVLDDDLLSTIKMTPRIELNDKVTEVPLERQSGGIYSGEFTPEEDGVYKITTDASSPKFAKSSRSKNVLIKPADAIEADQEALNGKGKADTEEPSHKDNDMPPYMAVIIIGGVLLVVGVIVALIFVMGKKKEPSALSIRDAKVDETRPDYSDRPKPKEKPIELVKEMPKAKAPDLVDYERIEHGSLESLIKKGPEDAFNANADNYKTDEALEKLIRKGADPFAVGTGDNKQDDAVSDTADDGTAGSGFANNDDDSGFGIKKDDDAFGSGFADNDDDSGFGIKKDDDAFGSGFADNDDDS